MERTFDAKTIHAVIFDMDGTLIDTEKYLQKFWNQAAIEAGFQVRKEDFLAIRSLGGVYAEPFLQGIYGPEFDYWAIRTRRKELMKNHLEANGIERKPTLPEALKGLKEKGYKLAVATATTEERAFPYLREIEALDYFDQVICANMVKRGKPYPDIYEYACSQIGEKPENCVAVEDAPNGIRSAYSAGCHVIMVPDLTQPDEEISKMLTAKVDNLAGLLKWL